MFMLKSNIQTLRKRQLERKTEVIEHWRVKPESLRAVLSTFGSLSLFRFVLHVRWSI